MYSFSETRPDWEFRLTPLELNIVLLKGLRKICSCELWEFVKIKNRSWKLGRASRWGFFLVQALDNFAPPKNGTLIRTLFSTIDVCTSTSRVDPGISKQGALSQHGRRLGVWGLFWCLFTSPTSRPPHDVDSMLYTRWYLVATSNLFSTSIQCCQVRRPISMLSKRWINVKD